MILNTTRNQNAAQSTPQLGLIASILPPAISDTMSITTKCAATIEITDRIHIDPNHQIHIQAQTRPIRTQPQ
jgi:hypothetical protein